MKKTFVAPTLTSESSLTELTLRRATSNSQT